MKKMLVGIIIGLVTGVSASVVASGVWEKIDVLRNDIKVIVKGQEIDADNFLYNDTTYLPLRAIGEALGLGVSYNEENNTAIILEGANNMNKNTGQSTVMDVYDVPVYVDGFAGNLGYPYVDVWDIYEYSKSIGLKAVIPHRNDPDGNSKMLYQTYYDENNVLRQRILLDNIPGYGSAVPEDYWLNTIKPLLDDMAHQNK